MTKRVLLLVALCVFLSVSAFAADQIVVFNGGGSKADFGARIAAMGGTVKFQHDVLAVVSGISDADAASIGKWAGVAEVVADEEFQLDVESDSSDQDFGDVPASQANPATAFFVPRQWHLRAIGAHTAWAAGRTIPAD